MQILLPRAISSVMPILKPAWREKTELIIKSPASTLQIGYCDGT
jgi:hypothetical protein